jgi:23S rRNA (guanosine2251-2'-O)-methyltransferase
MNIIIGRKPVLEALNADEEIEQVYILYGQQGGILNAIRVAAKRRGIKCNQIPLERFRAFAPEKNAQGVIAVKEDYKFSSFDEILKDSKSSTFPLILILDEIHDPHNLGAILRSAEGSGVHSIIITKHHSATVTSTVTKVSAGATEHLNICRVNNLSQTIDELKKNGFWIVGSSLENARYYTEVDYKMPVALVVGNEEKGIRKLTARKCDFLVKIPMSGKIQSLNVSVATGILLFEILRQRRIT